MSVHRTKMWACARGGLVLGLCWLLFVPNASAVVPQAKRVIAAAAKVNKADRRAKALRFSIRMQIEDAEPIAEGELVSHPTGLARLELRAPGLVERHLLLGSEHTAARNGSHLPEPRSFLPPLFLLQADSASILKTAMEAFGVQRDFIGLAPCGDHDCYVIGDPDLAANGPPEPIIESPPEASRTDAEPSGWSGRADSELLEATENAEFSRNKNTFASIWIGTVDFEIKQIRSLDGVVVEFGPLVKYGKLAVPSWWSVMEADKRSVRFSVTEASTVNAPAGAFAESWTLAATVASDASEGAPDPRASQTPGDDARAGAIPSSP